MPNGLDAHNGCSEFQNRKKWWRRKKEVEARSVDAKQRAGVATTPGAEERLARIGQRAKLHGKMEQKALEMLEDEDEVAES